MLFRHLRHYIWRFTHRRFTSPEDYFLKRTRFGEINEFFKFAIISTDSEQYTLPFLTHPFRSKKEKGSWPGREGLDYEYSPEHPDWDEAHKHFEISYDMVKDRIGPNAKIFDVGCNAGFFLEQWKNKGFIDLHGLDPQTAAIAYARKTRPYLKVKEGFFGPPENDVECDLLVFFQSITRIPYQDRLFDAIDRCARKYVLISWVEDSCTLFNRDFHLNLAKKGLMCIEKRVFDTDFNPYGTNGTESEEGPMIAPGPNGKLLPRFASHFLFRRIEPRT